jgi:hypothetical protein
MMRLVSRVARYRQPDGEIGYQIHVASQLMFLSFLRGARPVFAEIRLEATQEQIRNIFARTVGFAGDRSTYCFG